jgi:FkbM family methyltransferase
VSAPLRTRAYRLATRLPDRARRALPEAVMASGPLRLPGGLGVGLLLDPPPLTHVQLYALVRGVLETPVQEALRRHVRPGDVVYDVGANLGFFSLLACHLGARVEAFEPLPRAAAAIRRSARHNGFDGLRVHEAAVGAAAGTATFLRVREGSWSHLADRGRHALTEEEVPVRVLALDDVDLPAPAFVKVDVEGSEVAVLDGAAGLLREARPVLVIETHETNAEVADRLEPLGYVLHNLDGPGPVRGAGPVHVLAVPSGADARP